MSATSTPGQPWQPPQPTNGSEDAWFWSEFERIQAAGRAANASEAGWLASLTQVDDLGFNGRAMFLSLAALTALKRMPEAAFLQGKHLWETLPAQASKYRKVGVCKVLESSGVPAAVPILQIMAEDDERYVRQEAQLAVARLCTQIEQSGHTPFATI